MGTAKGAYLAGFVALFGICGILEGGRGKTDLLFVWISINLCFG
jgi:hypothetical protein